MTISRTTAWCMAVLFCAVAASGAEMSLAEAERLLKESKDADLLFSLSFYYEEAGRPFSALRAIERAVAVDAKKPTFHARHGQLLLGRRRLQEAAAAYAKAAALAPETKSFKAAEARALAECGSWAEAIACWETLLTSARDSREALDAAANIERLSKQARQPAAAERAWLAAMAKTQNSSERLRCAASAAEAMLRQGEPARAVRHWEKLLASEQGWLERRSCAAGISAASKCAPPEERNALLEREIAAWQGLLESATQPAEKQEAAISLASAFLRAKDPAMAAAALTPHLRTGRWEQDMRAISALAQVYRAQGNAAALRDLWQRTLAEFHPLQLEAGRAYDIKLEYYERGGGAVIKLLWSGPEIPKQPVPPEALTPAGGDDAAQGLRGEYFGTVSLMDTKLLRVDANVNFDWGVGSPAPEIPPDNFSCRWTGKLRPPRSGVYHFYTVSDDGVRLWLDGRLLIDNWTDHGPTEDNSSGYRDLYPIFQQLAACASTTTEEEEIWQRACEMFPDEAQPRADLAEAFVRSGKYNEAIAAYEHALKLAAGRGGDDNPLYANFLQRLVNICCSQQRLEQATDILCRYAPNTENTWAIQQALYTIQGAGSAYSGMAAALKIAEAGGWRRAAAAEYLCQTPYRDLARTCLWAAVADQRLPGHYRYHLFERLANLARDPVERAEMRRQQAAAAPDVWTKADALKLLAGDLAQEGRVLDALAVVEEADGMRQNNWKPGPQTLATVAQRIFQGRRIGPGLRQAEDLVMAESVAEDLYRRWRDRDEYAEGFACLFSQLSQVRQQRGEMDAGLTLLRRAAGVREHSRLRLEIALLAAALAEAGKAADPMPEFTSYAEAVAAEQSQHLIKGKRAALPAIDRRLGAWLAQQKRYADFENEIMARLEQRQGVERQALAEVLLAYQKQQGRLDEMQSLLKRMDEWGFKDKVYNQELEWVKRGLALKNAASRADAEQRQRLLQDRERWQAICQDNPEDYQAVFNLAKCHALLGDEDKSRQIIESARQRWPKDPIVLEIYSRERMLDKGYAEAAQTLAQAAEITGRRLDYEESICGAYEMAGRFDLAIVLALDSLEAGLRSGQGFRSPEQIFDMAERSDNLAFLRQHVAARLQKSSGATLPSTGLLQLALRTAWHEADESLANDALSKLIHLAQQRHAMSPRATLMPLAVQAEARQRLADAIRLRQAIIDAAEAGGEAPQLDDYETLARLLLRKGEAGAAADLMFAGLSRALEGDRPSPMDYDEVKFARRQRRARSDLAPAPPATVNVSNLRLAWIRGIFNIIAEEHAAAGQEFQQACGDRVSALVEEEMHALASNPRLYAGPLLSAGMERALALTERITAAFVQRCQKPDAGADDHLALAERLTSVASLPLDAAVQRPGFAEIAAACSAAIEKADAMAKPAMARSRCRIYRRLFDLPEAARLPDLTAETLFQAYETAIALSANNLDLLQEAAQFARAQKHTERFLEWTRKRYQLAGGEASARAELAEALFASGAAQEAVDLLRQGFDKHSAYTDYRAAAEICWRQASAPEAARSAVEFCQTAIRLYEQAAGAQIDAKGKPLPDDELASLYRLLAFAQAACGKPDEAWQALLAFSSRITQPPLDDAAISAVAEAFAKANRRDDLLRLIASRVEAEPKSCHLRLLHANFLSGLGEYAAAADAMRAARALHPDLAIVKRLIALLRQSGDLRMALSEAMAWAESFPRDADVYQTMAEIYRDLKDDVGELRSLTMLVEVAPRDADNCRRVAAIFLERGEAQRAVGLLERAIELRPEEPYRHIDLAEALWAAKEMARAETVCRESLTRDWEKGLSPELLERMPIWRGTFEHRAHALLAEILEAQGKKDDAARERMQLPAGYKRPAFNDAVPAPQPRWRARGNLIGEERDR